MIKLTGTKVVSGISIGKLHYYVRPDKHIVKTEIEDVESELAIFRESKKIAINQLEDLYNSTVEMLGEINASIFVAQEMLLEDGRYNAFVEKQIREFKNNAAYSVALASDEFSRMFASMDDTYMQSHVADVKDVSDRVLRIISGTESDFTQPSEPCIFACDDFNAGDIVQFSRDKVLGLVTMFGSSVSHASILAGTMGIPSIIGLGQEMLANYDGMTAILDGINGVLYIDPDEKTLASMVKKQKEYEKKQKMLLLLKGKNNVTKSGAFINVYANISSVEDVDNALSYDAGGVGLFRSEFLFIESDKYPTEEDQFNAYKELVTKLRGRKAIIRTLDLGTDKQASYFRPEPENNPALGYRAVRVSLLQPEIFKTQLRALYRASAYGNLDIMFPMIISLDEVRRIKNIVNEVKEELDREGLDYSKDVKLGVMIETPAAAVISESLAKEVDFFSIGTNDLTQYTLAIDRQNPKLDSFFDAHHPAVLSLIEMTVANAHKVGIQVDICGELAADLSLTEWFIKQKIDALSVAPNMVLELRKKIRETD